MDNKGFLALGAVTIIGFYLINKNSGGGENGMYLKLVNYPVEWGEFEAITKWSVGLGTADNLISSETMVFPSNLSGAIPEYRYTGKIPDEGYYLSIGVQDFRTGLPLKILPYFATVFNGGQYQVDVVSNTLTEIVV